LPGYLIRLIPELRVEGQILATGPAFTMGSELIQNAAYFNAATAQWEGGEDNRPTVGEYIATALDLQGVSIGQITALKARLDGTKAKLDQLQQNPTDLTPLRNISKEDLSGDLMYSSILSYFASINANGNLIARSSHVVTQRMPSFGNFGSVVQTRFSFGVPRSVGFPGVQMDVDRIIGVEVAKDANSATLVSFRRAIGGQYSAYEHLIPERLFTDSIDPNRPQGISAVKALAIAASQGQRIYALNAQNEAIHAQALSSLGIDQVVKQELANALTVGKEVTIHQSNITSFGFTGAGYIIIDPETGAGAYKISGGASGAQLFFTIAVIVALMSLLAIQFIALLGGYLIISSVAAIAGLIASYLIPGTYDLDPLSFAIVKLVGLAILTIGVGNLMNPITSVLTAARLLGPVIMQWFFTLYELISKIFALYSKRSLIAESPFSVRIREQAFI